MDAKVYEQIRNVATLPGIVCASYAMPDAHWGYGFSIGGVAAFDSDVGGVVAVGGIGFDLSCGVRSLHTALKRDDVETVKEASADALHRGTPAGVGSTGRIRLDADKMDSRLAGGTRWAVERGGMAGAVPAAVSEHAKRRQRDEMGTLGSGNHCLEIQHVAPYNPGSNHTLGFSSTALATELCAVRGLDRLSSRARPRQ